MNRKDLKDYKYNQEWIKDRLEYIEEQRSIITKVTSTLTDMPMGNKKVQDSMAENIAALLDNLEDIMEYVKKESDKQKEILEQLNKVEQPYRLILEKAYIEGKKLVNVAVEMNYNYEYTKKANQIALKKFDEIPQKLLKVTL